MGVEIVIREAKHDSVGQVLVDTEPSEALRAPLRERHHEEMEKFTPESPLFVLRSNWNWK